MTSEEPRQSAVMGRWLASVKKHIPRTKYGLLDSEMLNRDWYAGDRPWPAEDLIGRRSSFVLLAPGGAGKSTLVGELERREPNSMSIDLRLDGCRPVIELLDSLPLSEFPPSELPARVVFIDAVDEALQVDPNIGYVLVKLLRRPGADRVAWRFVCRPGSWTVDLSSGLRAALEGFDELELLPLNLAQIREMAAADDADDFLAAVEEARLTRLLAYPLHASNLLNQWRGTGQLPANRSDAMRHTVTDMLTETSFTRLPGKLDDYRRRIVAERLAAISIFGGVGAFALGPVTPQPADASEQPSARGATVLAANSVPTQTEPDLSGTMLTVDDIREALGTTLFTAAGNGNVTFVHRSYTEFLAAAYLKRRGVAGQRLVSVLGANVNGLVPAPMIEVLGWLLASGSSVPDIVIADNAKQLLSTAGLELVDDELRKRLVEALLHGAAHGTIDEGWNTDTTVLSHPGLATQLHNAAANPLNHWVVFWICRIARQCTVREAADDLLEIALDSTWPDIMRAEAVKAFAEVAPRDRMNELTPLLHLVADEDPFDEILAAALRAMLPDAVNFDRIRAALRPRRALNYIGNYYQLLSELSALVPYDEVLATLTEALRHRTEHADRAFDRLVGGLLQRVWEMKDPAIAAVIGAALGSEPDAAQTLRSEYHPWRVDDDLDLRRAMAAAALAAHKDAFVVVLDLAILTPTDIGWLIDWMRAAPPEALEAARVTLRHLAWHVADAETVEQVLETREGHPAYETLADFQGARAISSRPQRLALRLENNDEPSSTAVESKLHNAIAHAREDVNDWWDVVIALAGDRFDDPEISCDWDLTRRPMWSRMSGEEKEEFLRLGLIYLGTRQPDVRRWQGRTSWGPDEVMPDWAAVFLLATLAAHRCDLLAAVESPTWVSWASTIVAMPAFMGHEAWLPQIRNAAPQAARDAIDEALRERVRQYGGTFAHHPLADFSDSRLIDVVAQLARNTDHSEARRDEAISVLIEHAPDIALDVARTTMTEDVGLPAAFTALAKLAPDELVARWIEQQRLDPEEGLSDLRHEGLSDDSLVALAGMLLDEIPFAADPARTDDFVERAPDSVARQLRTRLLQSMAGRGMASHMAALAHDRPAADQEMIRHLGQEARARETLLNWQPVQPGTLMEVLARGDARLVRNSAGLLTVLLEQLDLIQHDLHGRALFRSLWDGEPGAEDASPKNEDTISDWLAHELRLRLTPQVVVDREIQVTRTKDAGIGTRIDITASSGGVDFGRVIFEAKRINNSELLTAVDDQLVAKYMQPAALTHGIYIVYWTTPGLRPSTWDKKHPDAKALAEELREQARRHLPESHVEVVVLDIGPMP
ncbi:hypothetical protein [Nocardia nova]|uniref:hypothetical protein n=1 Tax=Nocardia nova TaxID=37330 RepID=UPI0033E84F80